MLSSSVGSPHHLVSQCVEEYVVRSFHDFDVIVGFPDGQASTFTTSFASSVYGYQEVVASALHIEGDFAIVVDNNWTDIETMWRYRCDGYGLAMRYNNRSANAQ